MGKRSRTGVLDIWMNGQKVGRWTVRPNGEHRFAYVETWLVSDAVRPISLSLPLLPASQSYRGDRVEAYFDNLLPDARPLRERLRRRLGAASTRPFDLLAEAGRDCVGAVQLLPDGQAPTGYDEIRGKRLSTGDVERHLARVGAEPLGQLDEKDEFRISLAGVQEKTALLFHRGHWQRPLGATPTTHILKLPIGIAPQGIDLSTSVENEWLCGEILRGYGLPVARTEIARFGTQTVLVVERFDRRLAPDGSWIMRLPQEDLCQATATPPSMKYESDGGPGVRAAMDVLAGSDNASADRDTFMRAQILFWLLCAIDGHAKNFSVYLEPGGGYRLTPLYDVLSAYPVLGRSARELSPRKVKLAMAIEGTQRHYVWDTIVRRHWNEMARRCGFARDAEALIADLVARTPSVVDAVSNRVPRGFPPKVTETILAGLQRSARRLESSEP
jgi:serine/threonine-protein kinase HipA